eukprot:TRINITY_DN3664_c0_g1_i2.p1 TRINITY_DN3664_c0_g1~~TRINITY_DN3664_c0_g1_i2.p1  ORF type:complete len:241 (+),score=87.48 TRINITY_DN3664_c0_g1_i2:143-865(+)
MAHVPKGCRFGNLGEVPRHDVARTYAATQVESEIMLALGATYDDLYAYGAEMYDKFVAEDGISFVFIENETNTMVAMCMICKTDTFHKIDESKLGTAAPHAALCKELQKPAEELVMQREKIASSSDIPCMYGVFGWVDKRYRGGGMRAMADEFRYRQQTSGYLYGWAFTLPNRHGTMAPGQGEGKLTKLHYSYARNPFYSRDVAEFEYDGAKPFVFPKEGPGGLANIAVWKMMRPRKSKL